MFSKAIRVRACNVGRSAPIPAALHGFWCRPRIPPAHISNNLTYQRLIDRYVVYVLGASNHRRAGSAIHSQLDDTCDEVGRLELGHTAKRLAIPVAMGILGVGMASAP